MERITINGRIDFCDTHNKGYSRDFTATLEESGAFAYGNGTAIQIVWGVANNGIRYQRLLLDTRYDTTIKATKQDFATWLKEYFANNYENNVITIY